jgi:transposase-like protein
MTDDNMALLALIQKTDDGDFLKSVAEAALQRIMDYDVENLIGAAPHERIAERLTYRNGYRERTLEMIGLSVGQSEAAPFWIDFLRALNRRGLKGVKLVISDAHEGRKTAIAQVLGATWQRRRVHTMRNLLVRVPKAPKSSSSRGRTRPASCGAPSPRRRTTACRSWPRRWRPPKTTCWPT